MIPLFILLSTWLLTEKCYAEQNNQTDCSRLPKSIAPHICCRFPEPFEGQILDECHRLHNEFGQCFVECLFGRADICRHGKCSYQRANKYLDNKFVLQQTIFKDIYKSAFKKCIEKGNGLLVPLIERFRRNGCHPVPELIRFCVRNEMFISCPNGYWNEKLMRCTKKQQFIRHCTKEN
uniref:Odorant-binding protein n=1 Tax=Bactrocera correcta TaxID=47773 RepID=A0A6M9TYU5_BACCC|nr:odorant-binding protein [Bactrocera correcta]